MDAKIERLQYLINNSKHIVFFGGAGVSTESGIKDFRSKDGLYNLQSKYGRPYEEMLSHTYFYEHTDTFYKFYKEFMIPEGVKPNAAHIFLANLEKKKDVVVITQNIDGLHQEAGSDQRRGDGGKDPRGSGRQDRSGHADHRPHGRAL